MGFVAGKCPECQGELQIPPKREHIICMYCGCDVETREAISKAGKQSGLTDEKRVKMSASHLNEASIKTIIETFPQMLFSVGDPLKNFTKDRYEKDFKEYVKEHRQNMEDIEEAYHLSEEAFFLEALAKGMVEEVNRKLYTSKNKRQRENELANYNMSLVTYVNPALIDTNKESGMPLAEELIKQWKTTFPRTNLKISTFETIHAGFKKRFCYITTAVCSSLGKPDHCYELKILRGYRDGYLKEQEDGEELVKHYYDIAPTIVKRINKKPDQEKIYKNIWNEYLFPCIQMIEEDENEGCMSLYRSMVEDLEWKYFRRGDNE